MEFTKLYPDQDPKNLYLYEILGSYFTDVLFNHIYLNTKMKLGKKDSIIDEFSKRLQLYVMGIKNDKKCYISVFQGLHKFYNTVLHRSTTEQEFINTILFAFLPPDFMKELNTSQTIEIISNIICELVSNLVVYASSPNIMSLIINQHVEKAGETIKLLQDYSIHVLINKKIQILNKIMKETGQVQDERSPPIEVINNMKQIIKDLLMEKNQLIDELHNKEQCVNELIENEKKLKKLILLLNIQTNIYKKHSKENNMQNEFIEEVIQKTDDYTVFQQDNNIPNITKSYEKKDNNQNEKIDEDEDEKEEDEKEDKEDEKEDKEDEKEEDKNNNEKLQLSLIPQIKSTNLKSDSESDTDSDDS